MNFQTYNEDPIKGGFRGFEVKGDSFASGSASRNSRQVRLHNAPDKRGIPFARMAKAQAVAGDGLAAVEYAKAQWPNDTDVHEGLKFKASVPAASMDDESWGSVLAEPYRQAAGQFIEFIRPQTIVGKLLGSSPGIPSATKIPFRTTIPRQISTGAAAWVKSGHAKPLTRWSYDSVSLGFAKVSAIAVLTEELARSSSPDAEILFRNELANSVIERLDTDFVALSKAAVPDESPASITYGAPTIPSSGEDADAIREDIRKALATYLAARHSIKSAVWIMPSITALSLSLMKNALGGDEWPGVSVDGGKLAGIAIIVSDYAPAGHVILVSAPDILIADDGIVDISTSREASLEMSDSPTHDSVTPTGTQLVSMWQTNSIAVRAERFINWERRRPNSTVVISNVAWGGPIALS